MKKAAFILGGLFIISLALTSCKKDFTCECTYTDGTKITYTFENTTKKLADDLCTGYVITGKTCELK